MKKSIYLIIIVILAVGVGIYLFLARNPKAPDEYYYPAGDAFVTNVIDSQKLIKTAVVISTSRDATDELTEKNAVVRDCILHVLRNHPEENYLSGDLQEQLSEAIVARLNEHFPQDAGAAPLFIRAYFSEFVLQ